jgi:CheY-like chemotaxis protein
MTGSMRFNNGMGFFPNFNWSGKTILIAEDDHFSYIYLKEMLSATGATILYADNGIRAFAECLKNPDVNVVLMDVKMPVVNGLESTRLIKKYKPSIKIIAQTAFAMIDDKIKCINAGCDDYISKPVMAEELFTKLAALLSPSESVYQQNADFNSNIEEQS